ncbi:MAG TPA: glycosyltransferase [Mycobacteriales bacterium]
MRFAFATRNLPEQYGGAAGRQLWAVGEALLAAGHDVTAWCWRPEPPRGEVPAWCTWRPLPAEAAWRTRTRALLRPRTDAARGAWTAPADAVAVADDPVSWAAVAGQGARAVATVHYSVALDRRALADHRPAVVQDARGERRAVRRADAVWALSTRVRDAVGRGVVVPACVPVPASVVPPVDAPVAGLLADWSWAPNRAAAGALVRGWPAVRAAVPGARLLLAGRGAAPVGAAAGVEWLGEVPATADLLAQVAVFAFPCPPTSGPKMKVLDALAHGIPVLTTPAGAEGIAGDTTGALAVQPERGFTDRLVALLSDPPSRTAMGAAGRRLLVDGHAPAVAAQARVAAAQRLAADATARG